MLYVAGTANPFSFSILIFSNDGVGFVIPISCRRNSGNAYKSQQRVQVFKGSHDSNPFLKSVFVDFIQKGRETSICCSTHLCIHWLILSCALTQDWTHNFGVLGGCSYQMSYLARALTHFLKWFYELAPNSLDYHFRGSLGSSLSAWINDQTLLNSSSTPGLWVWALPFRVDKIIKNTRIANLFMII